MRRVQARSSAGVYPLLDIKTRPPSGMHSCLPAYSYTSFPPFPPYHPLLVFIVFSTRRSVSLLYSASWFKHSFTPEKFDHLLSPISSILSQLPPLYTSVLVCSIRNPKMAQICEFQQLARYLPQAQTNI